MSAGIRIGVITAHKDIIAELVIHMENSVLHASSLSQVKFGFFLNIFNAFNLIVLL